MTTVNLCRFCCKVPTMVDPEYVTHECGGVIRAVRCDVYTWNVMNHLPAPKAQGETMDKPWIDGSVQEPPKGEKDGT